MNVRLTALACIATAASGCGLLLDFDPTGRHSGPGDASTSSDAGDASDSGAGPSDVGPGDGSVDAMTLPTCGAPPVQLTNSVPFRARQPKIAWAGESFIVGWFSDDPADIALRRAWVTRVDVRGQRLDATDLFLGVSEASTDYPHPAAAGDRMALAWEDSRGTGSQVRFAFLDVGPTSLVLVDEQVVTDSPVDANEPVLAWDGAGFGLAWTDQRTTIEEVYFRRLDGSGAPVTPEERVALSSTGSDAGNLNIATAAGTYGLTWAEGAVVGRYAVVNLESGFNATVLDNVGSESDDPNIAAGSEDYAVVWQEDDPTRGVGLLLDPASTPTDASDGPRLAPILVSGADQPFIVWNGGGYAITYEYRGDDGSKSLALQRVASGGALIGETEVVSEVPGHDSEDPWVAWSGTGYGVVWEDDRSGTFEVWFAHVCP